MLGRSLGFNKNGIYYYLSNKPDVCRIIYLGPVLQTIQVPTHWQVSERVNRESLGDNFEIGYVKLMLHQHFQYPQLYTEDSGQF